VDVIPKPEDVRDLGTLFANGWALAAFFSDLKGSKSELRESNPVLRELGDTLKAVQTSARQSEQSSLLKRVEELLEALEAERGGRRR
jgi:hypothetical protein